MRQTKTNEVKFDPIHFIFDVFLDNKGNKHIKNSCQKNFKRDKILLIVC